jgi:UDP:flavonoid glycosyltransferase YjiC (YdhE family)
MRVALVTAGTRGDAQPLTVLALELKARGHDVVLGVSPNLVPLGEAAGIESLPFAIDTQAFMESPEGRRWLASGNVRAFTNRLKAISHEHFAQTCRDTERVVAGADVVVAGILAEDVALPYAQAAGVPVVTLHTAPFRPTRAVPAPLVTTRALPGPLNRATGALFERVWWRSFVGDVTAVRNALDLPQDRMSTSQQMAATGAIELQAYSSAVVPADDLGPRRPLIGFLAATAELRHLWNEDRTDPDLDSWLDAGDPPVYLGFGSFPIEDPAATLAMARSVCRRVGVRALISAGWSRMADEADDDVRVVGALAHDAVLPRCRAAVHHGGAGTTAAALAAGLPSLVCSSNADQPFWGSRVERLGVGAHLRFSRLDERTLEQGLRRVLEPGVAERAAALGARLRAEPPAAPLAADLVESAVRHPVG